MFFLKTNKQKVNVAQCRKTALNCHQNSHAHLYSCPLQLLKILKQSYAMFWILFELSVFLSIKK